ncbi:MAG TPA: AAA family ATPase [Candidatus Paceibacterota bacterium]|nr:AAA family ATPase [Candidatus Paceibacterota bacterium]
MAKQIIGITGPIAAGKGTIAEYFKERHNATLFRFSSSLFSIVEILGLPNDREHLSRLSRVLREGFGEDTLARALATQVEKSTAPLIIVDGVRRPDDVTFLERQPGFRLIYIDAPMETRFARMKLRGEKSDDVEKTMEQFVNDHKLESELLIDGLKARSAVIIDNSGSKEELYAQLERLLNA